MSADGGAQGLGSWERRRFRTALEIECAGLDLMAERGLEEVTAEQVATAAGLSLRTFFRYFKNTGDVLMGVPRRETDRICRLLLARPAEEDLIAAFLAVFDQYLGAEMTSDEPELELAALGRWTEIVRQWPDAAQATSNVTAMLAAGLEAVVRTRLGAAEDDDSLTPGSWERRWPAWSGSPTSAGFVGAAATRCSSTWRRRSVRSPISRDRRPGALRGNRAGPAGPVGSARHMMRL